MKFELNIQPVKRELAAVLVTGNLLYTKTSRGGTQYIDSRTGLAYLSAYSSLEDVLAGTHRETPQPIYAGDRLTMTF